MVIRCPNCREIFNDDKSYENHLPCLRSLGGESDLRESKFGQDYAKKGGTDEYG
jgi:hypothetical protein